LTKSDKELENNTWVSFMPVRCVFATHKGGIVPRTNQPNPGDSSGEAEKAPVVNEAETVVNLKLLTSVHDSLKNLNEALRNLDSAIQKKYSEQINKLQNQED
jgi:hypothetical protein